MFTQQGEAIRLFKQHACHRKGQTIHSSGQIEWCKGNIVHDQSLKVGGAQHVRTLDGYALPIDIDNGLLHISQVPHTQKEFHELPHVIFSSSAEWDPTVLDNKLSSQPNWFNIVKNDAEDGHLRTSPFDAHGNYIYRYPNEKPCSRNSKIQHTEIRSLLVSKPIMTMMTTPQWNHLILLTNISPNLMVASLASGNATIWLVIEILCMYAWSMIYANQSHKTSRRTLRPNRLSLLRLTRHRYKSRRNLLITLSITHISSLHLSRRSRLLSSYYPVCYQRHGWKQDPTDHQVAMARKQCTTTQ